MKGLSVGEKAKSPHPEEQVRVEQSAYGVVSADLWLNNS